MKKVFTVLFFLVLLISNTPAQWQQIANLPTWTYFGGCIDALGDDFCVFTNSGNQINITADAGKTWTTKNLPQGEQICDISLVSKNIFYIATTGNLSTAGNFYKTTDGGNTWASILINPGLTSCGNYIKMFSETTGIAMGDGPMLSPTGISNKALILKTINGTDWQQSCFQDIGWSADVWRRLDFVDENNGYFFRSGMGTPDKLIKTTDGGVTWTNTNFSGLGWLIKFYNKDYGFVYEYDAQANINLIDRTTNGGSNWQRINIAGLGRVNDIEFIPGVPSNVWLGGSSGLYYSADSGKTWVKKFTAERFDDIVFPTDNTGWVVTTGKLYYTNNNGRIGTGVVQEKNLPVNFELFQNYPNPFNPETVISYQLSALSNVRLKIYDLLGREIATLVNEYQQPGVHNLQFSIRNLPADGQGSQLPSGVYYYRLSAGGYSASKKMILLK